MIKFTYIDGEKLCLYRDGEITVQNILFLENYRQNVESMRLAKKWKTSGEGAAFRGELERTGDDPIEGLITGVAIADSNVKCVYSFFIGEISGIYYKDLETENDNESHIITSVDVTFSGLFCDVKNGFIVCSLQKKTDNADLALFDLKKGDYKTLTEGDTMDEFPFISPDDSDKIYFSSRGVGRDASGEFCGYSPSSICLLDLSKMEVTTLLENKKYNFIKPVFYNGELYSIRTPVYKRGRNPIVEIVLLPFRFLQALASVIYLFILSFTGKKAVSGGSGGNNPTKKRDLDEKQIYIDGNLVNADKEDELNSKKKDKDLGLIPLDWKLINSKGKELFSGVADYDIDSDGNIFVTNGKHIFMLKDGEKRKLCDCYYCVNISCSHECNTPASIFDL